MSEERRYSGPRWEDFEQLSLRIQELEKKILEILTLASIFVKDSNPDLSWLDMNQKCIYPLEGGSPIRLYNYQFRLLSLLSLSLNKWVWHEDIVRFVWQGRPQADPRHGIRNLVYELRLKLRGIPAVIEMVNNGEGWRLRNTFQEQSVA